MAVILHERPHDLRLGLLDEGSIVGHVEGVRLDLLSSFHQAGDGFGHADEISLVDARDIAQLTPGVPVPQADEADFCRGRDGFPDQEHGTDQGDGTQRSEQTMMT